MGRTEIEALVARWVHEGVALGNAHVWEELTTDDVRDETAGLVGRDGFAARAAKARASFDDLRVDVGALVVEGNAIAWRWSLHGTRAGAPVVMHGVNFQTLEDGRVARHWTLAKVD
jgi:predicted ester cyclase